MRAGLASGKQSCAWQADEKGIFERRARDGRRGLFLFQTFLAEILLALFTHTHTRARAHAHTLHLHVNSPLLDRAHHFDPLVRSGENEKGEKVERERGPSPLTLGSCFLSCASPASPFPQAAATSAAKAPFCTHARDCGETLLARGRAEPPAAAVAVEGRRSALLGPCHGHGWRFGGLGQRKREGQVQ